MKKIYLMMLIFLFLLTKIAYSAGQIIINSEDWRDVYSGMLYGSLTKTTANFLVSARHSRLILNSIPKGTPLEVISSKSRPFIVGYESVLRNEGYPATENIYDNANLELAKKLNVTNFIIVDDSYGYNAISVAPYAIVSNSYVLFADRNNIREIDSFLSGRTVNKILIYGNIDRQVKNTLAKYNPEIINKEGDRFANNIEIVKKYQEIKHSKQAVLTNGEFIEKEIMSGLEPVIFIGSNNVPDIAKEYIQSSEIEIGILIGNELVGTATYIRRNVGISVFVKFAQGARAPRGAISQVEALDMFYLPVYSLNIELDSIKYNRATNKLEVSIRNTEEQAVYLKGTYTIKGPGGLEQKVGDIEPVFLDGKELRTFVYDVEPIPEGNITAHAYIIYGESKGSMEKVIDKTVIVETVEILDRCKIKLTGLKYDKRKGIFYIDIENIGDVDCYVDVEIVDILIDKIPQSFGADDIAYIKAGKSKKQKVRVKLEEEDIEDNGIVKVRAYYGERKDSLVKIIEAEFELILVGIDYLFYSLLIIIIILIILILWKRKKKKEKHKHI